MKKKLLYAILLFSLPLYTEAQFGGGSGRGETNLEVSGNALNNAAANLYSGGNGRGEITGILNSSPLNNTAINIFLGGNGRGENTKEVNANPLNGDMLNLFGGGNGRGDSSMVINNNQLDGVKLSIYSGGIGRGEHIIGVNTLQLDGTAENSMFMGGGGRGENMQQQNTIALPVKLLSFAALLAGNEVKVQWQTATELNSAYFVVEKSTNGSSWQSIGKINAAGHSDLPLSYQLFDSQPVEGINYYRLKPTDLDGKFTYSAVAAVNYHTGNDSKIIVYPNPVKYQFTVSLQGSQTSARLRISLVNAQGQTIFDKQNLNGNTQTFNISNLAGGTYFLLINNNGDISTTKIVKE